MWISWRTEQVVMKQDMHRELWVGDLMKTALDREGTQAEHTLNTL
jgi:hypothetical protein